MGSTSKGLFGVFYKLLYFCIHSIFTLFEFMRHFYTKLPIICHEFGVPPINKQKKLVKFKKVPAHMAILLGSEEPSFQDLANLVVWCMAVGTSFISFHDYEGTLKKHEDKFRAIVDQAKGQDHVIWHKDPESSPKNGFVGRKIHVKVLAADEGKWAVVDTCRKFASGGQTDFSIDSFDEALRRRFEFPDPDLGLCCGKTFCLYNYPPWQVRVTEFIRLDSHENITFDIFVNSLEQYNRCEQRFGK